MKTGPDFVVHVTQNSRSRGRQISFEFKANLVYIESFRTVRDTQNNPVSKKKKDCKDTQIGVFSYHRIIMKCSLSYGIPVAQ